MKHKAIHYCRRPPYGKRTACGHIFNKRTMNATHNAHETTCPQCKRSRYYKMLIGKA